MEQLIHHATLFTLGILLFFITNFIGKYSRNFGYSEIKFDINSDELAGFNIVLRLLTPAVFTIIISSIFYYLELDILTNNIYLSVLYSYLFRFLWNIFHNRTLLINWYAQISYAALATAITYVAYKYLIIPKNSLFPNPETLANELWILIILFLYKIFNEVKFPKKFKEKRINKYITKRYICLKNKFEPIVNREVDLKYNLFISKVELNLSFPPNIRKYRVLYHCLLPNFKNLLTPIIHDITYSIMIYEDFNRPFLFRKVERMLCWALHRRYSQGIMQVQSTTPLDDNASISLAIEIFYDEIFNILKNTEYSIWTSSIINSILSKYNNSNDYIESINVIINHIQRSDYSDFENFMNNLEIIGVDPIVGE